MSNIEMRPGFPTGLIAAKRSEFAGGVDTVGILNDGLIEHGPDAIMTVPTNSFGDDQAEPSSLRYNEETDEFEGAYLDGWRGLGGATGRWETPVAAPSLNTVPSRGYLVDTRTAVTSVILPLATKVGQAVSFADLYGTFSQYPLTVQGNGKNIYGAGDDLVISTKNCALTFTWTGDVRGWIVTQAVGLGQGMVYNRVLFEQSLTTTTASVTLTFPSPMIDVYVNGLRLASSKYNQSNDSTVNFTPALTGTNQLMIIEYTPVKIAFDNGFADLSSRTGALEGRMTTAENNLNGFADSTQGDSKVAVKQPFTGSVAETQHDINRRSVGIYSFGVAANGSATGGTDDTAKVQAALDWCASTNQTLDLQGAKLFIAGTLTYHFKKHSIIGNNATFFVADGNTDVWVLLGSTSPGTALADSSAYEYGGWSMYPGVVAVVRTGRTGFNIGSSTLDCGGMASDNISLSGFNIGVTFGNNSYIHNFTKWKFTRCNKGLYYPPGLSNSGENINLSHCVFANSDTCIDAGGDCVINVRDTSFDYTPEKIYAHAGGIVKCNNCWFEGNDDTSVWIHTLNQLSTVILDKCTFVVAGPRTKYLFDGATPQGGVILISPMITTTGNPVISTPTWGTNNTVVVGTPIYRRPDVSNDTIPFSAGMSSVVSPNFDLTFTDSMRSDFSLRPASAGTTNRTETTSTAAGVTYNAANGYLTMQPPTGNVARITRTMLASPGATVTASAYVKNTFGNATDQLDLNLYFKNAAGVTIALYNKRFNSAAFNATAARANVLRGISAPQGTAFIMFEITTTNPAVDGSSSHQISNFNIEAGNGVVNIPYDTTQSPASGFIPYVYGATSAGTGTYTVQQGGYTLVGNLVFVNMTITWSGHTGVGQLKVGALPYLTDFPAGEIMNVMSTGITTTGALLGVMDAYSNSMIINQQGATGTLSSLQVPAAGTLQITGVYRRC